MKERFLEAGRIVNTHGIRGEVKIEPWADSPDFIAGFKRLYIDGNPIEVKSARPHRSCVIASLGGVEDLDAAIRLKNKTVYIDREDAKLEEGRHFVADIIGINAVDAATGDGIGAVTDILSLPAGEVYVIKGVREVLVPAVPEFVEELNIEAGYMRIRLIEGML